MTFLWAEKLLLSTVDVFIFDCDGVIWKGDSLIPGIPAVIEKLRAAGKKIFFVTNNSTKSRKGYKAKFDELGLSVKPEEIFSSSFAAAAYFEKTNFKDTGKKVYIIGERGIQEELDLVGVPWCVNTGTYICMLSQARHSPWPGLFHPSALILGMVWLRSWKLAAR